MQENKIIVEKPYISKTQELTRLEACITWIYENNKIEMPIFYEVDERWKEYLVTELSDAFILALLEFAMEKGCDIYYEEPMTETLKYRLERYLIPIYGRKVDGLKKIRLIGPTTCMKLESKGVTGTGFSGGVDSFYSVLSHMNTEFSSKNVTHLLLAVNGAAATGMTEEIDKKWFEDEKKRFEPVAKSLGLEFIGVNSNISLINRYRKLLTGGSAIPTSSFVHALRKLFGTYYWASAYEADILKFDNEDGGFMEPFSVPNISTDGLTFYHSGCEVSRIEKVKYIADFDVVQKNLTVCGNVVNCGHCFKCLRTMAELNAIGKLELFGEVFDIKDFKQNYSSKLAREFALDHKPFTSDIKNTMRENGKRISIIVIIKEYLIFKPFYFLKKKLRNNRFLMKLYYLKGLDKLLGEGEHNLEYAKARLEGKDY